LELLRKAKRRRAARLLLFMLGHVEDATLVWRAKNVNFDAHCYIDSAFLVWRTRRPNSPGRRA
jgi:hypothetical protein